MFSQSATPAEDQSSMARAQLPVEQLNPYIKNLDLNKLPAVKFQEIVRDGQSTVVARVKIPTPSGHAFILRRLDTGAISLTTMFRAAFPTATDDQERAESAWVKHEYKSIGANKSGKARFAGTWVTPDIALQLANGYSLLPIIEPLAAATPDPTIAYRKSSRAQQGGTPTSSPATAVGTPQDKDKDDNPPPAKRRRDGSPAPPTQVSPSRSRNPAATSTPVTRRSARLRSPGPTPLPGLTLTTPRSAKVGRSRAPAEHVATFTAQEPTPTPAAEDDTTVSALAAPNMEEDVAEQRALIDRLKTERAAKLLAAMPLALAAEDTLTESDTFMVKGESGIKRVREEESVEVKLNIKEPETEERAIVTNSRVRRILEMPPQRKSIAWGALFFAAGMSAVTFLPTLPGFFS